MVIAVQCGVSDANQLLRSLRCPENESLRLLNRFVNVRPVGVDIMRKRRRARDKRQLVIMGILVELSLAHYGIGRALYKGAFGRPRNN